MADGLDFMPTHVNRTVLDMGNFIKSDWTLVYLLSRISEFRFQAIEIAGLYWLGVPMLKSGKYGQLQGIGGINRLYTETERVVKHYSLRLNLVRCISF